MRKAAKMYASESAMGATGEAAADEVVWSASDDGAGTVDDELQAESARAAVVTSKMTFVFKVERSTDIS
jgi:Arc/MetJ family transcription regulator